MVLEATILCLDNSEFMRNGDYFPTRMEAQNDAVNMVMGWKFQGNPESTVGVMKMAPSPEVLVTPSPEIGKILTALHALKITGEVDLISSIQVAQLALKHRQNKNQHQRMVIFIGSPLKVETRALTRLGAALKKNNVAVDVINFGDTEANNEKLAEFVKAVNNGDNSHLVTVEAGRQLTDAVRRSPVYGDESGATGGGSGGGGGGAGDFPFGIDPSEDPELAMAIRASIEDEERRRKQGGDDAQDADMQAALAAEDEDELLRQAIAMSMASDMQTETTETPSQQTPTSSSDAPKPDSATPSTASALPDLGVMNDPALVNEILKSLPGVDFDDPSIQSILATVGQQGQQQEQQQGKDDDAEMEEAMRLSMGGGDSKKEEDKNKKESDDKDK
eukprot:TRINITY_DN536_c0_g1_i1.p1 TRINITY_DN536_c0_g1~~TRINITY_DN536_c0_g1_i1.p1  ORF type:complete len:390 (+),score=88.72 TRINITY_DN536_c0_g1_i1:52-1221(+)